jgi:hypothetical protein
MVFANVCKYFNMQGDTLCRLEARTCYFQRMQRNVNVSGNRYSQPG